MAQKLKDSIKIRKEINNYYDLKHLRSDKSVWLNKNICFIPMEFYFEENPYICDEKITYTAPVNYSFFEEGKYSVRFYIFGNRRYFRVTQDLLTVKNNNKKATTNKA